MHNHPAKEKHLHAQQIINVLVKFLINDNDYYLFQP